MNLSAREQSLENMALDIVEFSGSLLREDTPCERRVKQLNWVLALKLVDEQRLTSDDVFNIYAHGVRRSWNLSKPEALRSDRT